MFICPIRQSKPKLTVAENSMFSRTSKMGYVKRCWELPPEDGGHYSLQNFYSSSLPIVCLVVCQDLMIPFPPPPCIWHVLVHSTVHSIPVLPVQPVTGAASCMPAPTRVVKEIDSDTGKVQIQ